MKDEHKWTIGYRHFNTFSGDMTRALLSAVQNKVIHEENLLENVRETGDYLRPKLEALSEKYPDFIADVRGLGCYLAFDVPAGFEKRDKLVPLMRAQGVNFGICGVNSMRLRPNLYFGKKHADILLDALEKSVKQL